MTGSEQLLVETVRRLATPGPAENAEVATVRLSRFDIGDGRETWLQVDGPLKALVTVVNYFGYDYHVIGLSSRHVVLLVTAEAAAAYTARVVASDAARLARKGRA